MHSTLDHEKLDVYQQSLQFIAWTVPLLGKVPRTASVRNQLDRASTSIPLNIAEGNGRFTSPDRCHFFDNARGSALECAACLDVMTAKEFVERDDIQQGKTMLVKMVSMLFGLTRANSDARVFESPEHYGNQREEE
jgi:four helix bundle protein